MLNSIYYSVMGTTERISNYITKGLCKDLETVNFRESPLLEQVHFSNEDVVVVSMPVYGGRIPVRCVEQVKMLEGNEATAIAVVVYGNRLYGDALLELADSLKEQGFRVKAAGAFIAQHSLLPKVAEGRPDKEDYKKLDEFIVQCNENIKLEKKFYIPGNKPYGGKNVDDKMIERNGIFMSAASMIMKKIWHERKEPEWYL